MSLSESFEIWEALQPFVETLEKLRVSYYLSGSLASAFCGVARATQDADVVADLQIRHLMPMIQELDGRYYLSEDRAQQAIQRRSSFNLIHFATSFKVDVFVLGQDAFAVEAMGRRRRLGIPTGVGSVHVCTAEDIVLHKLSWYKQGNQISDRQWNDLQGVLRLQGQNLSLDYLRGWAESLELGDLLSRALKDAGIE